MAETTYTKYPINKLNNTYYQVARTTSFWSSKEKIDHSFYVNGYHHGIGAYSLNEMLFWKDFVEFLNHTCFFTSASRYTEYFNRPIVQWFLKLIDRYTFKDIHTSIMSFSFRDCSLRLPFLSTMGSELSLLSQIMSFASLRVVPSGAVTSLSMGVMNSLTLRSVDIRLTL